ncbi:uncharacterized protein JCM10292_002116 [Rhodotorula paludigena]|uniref:uncharacterized protein n=1 Tax=Rhodotorula paludigena TaxID=86838 RepID=UPI00317DD20F
MDLLPDELVLRILEEVAPPAYSPKAYSARQNALLSLCSVSRRMRALAQPLLWRFVRVHERSRLDSLAQPERLRRCARTYHVSPEGIWSGQKGWFTLQEGVEALSLLPEVTELRLDSLEQQINLKSLQDYTGLRSLSLVCADIDDSDPVFLHNLEALHLEDVRLDPDLLATWLSPTYLPSLKALYLSDLRENIEDAPFFPTLSPAILSQLDFVQTLAEETDAVAKYGQSVSPPFLFQLHPPVLDPTSSAPLPRNITLDSPRLRLGDTAEKLHTGSYQLPAFGQLLDAFRAEHAPVPHSILLPRELVMAAGRADVDVVERVRAFEDACARNGVRLGWWGGAEGEADDTLVSPEFWEYARRLRREQERADGGV